MVILTLSLISSLISRDATSARKLSNLVFKFVMVLETCCGVEYIGGVVKNEELLDWLVAPLCRGCKVSMNVGKDLIALPG